MERACSFMSCRHRCTGSPWCWKRALARWQRMRVCLLKPGPAWEFREGTNIAHRSEIVACGKKQSCWNFLRVGTCLNMTWNDVMWYDMIWHNLRWCDVRWSDGMGCDVIHSNHIQWLRRLHTMSDRASKLSQSVTMPDRQHSKCSRSSSGWGSNIHRGSTVFHHYANDWSSRIRMT